MGLFSAVGKLFDQKANATPAALNTYDFAPTMKASSANALAGYDTFLNNQKQEQSLADTLLAQSHGEGPNPAQLMLNQQTGNNIASQSALMAGQRGAGTNAGLMARQIGQQGGNIQQQAVGQGALMNAQQQLNSQGQLQGMYGQMGNENIGEQNANIGLFGAATGGMNAQNQASLANAQMMNSNNQFNAQQANQTGAGLMQGIGGLASLPGLFGMGGAASGGGGGGSRMGQTPTPYATGGEVEKNSPINAEYRVISPFDDSKKENPKLAKVPQKDRFAFGGMSKDLEHMASIYHAHGGMAYAGGGEVKAPMKIMEEGGKVPGKAKVKGDSLKNDIVDAKLSPKEIVLPRSITMAPDAPEKAREFVAALLAKEGNGNGGSKEHGDFKEALKTAMMNRKKK